MFVLTIHVKKWVFCGGGVTQEADVAWFYKLCDNTLHSFTNETAGYSN